MEESWTNLLNTWRDKNKFGLTVPFLFGGLLQHPNHPLEKTNSLKEKFQKLLELISKFGIEGKCARLAYCDKADDLIVAPVNGRPTDCKRVVDSEGRELKLWVQHDIQVEDHPSIASLTRILWEKYEDAICQGNYSRRGGIYLPFDENDKQILREAYERNT